jgi:hypothetical protein
LSAKGNQTTQIPDQASAPQLRGEEAPSSQHLKGLKSRFYFASPAVVNHWVVSMALAWLPKKAVDNWFSNTA